MAAIQKTNAARLLDKAGIKYKIVPYEVDPENLAADHVAESLNEPIERVYKTLVLHGDKTGYIVCILAGNCEVDLKKAAKASGNKKIEMIPMKDLLSVTGYIRGGCTAIGMKKKFPTYIQEDCLNFDFIYVSAGQRGLQLMLSPRDLIKIADAIPTDIIA
jgi:Cys-tRNA(Pro)/Cys-tRNA(Cys) deacylase